MKRLQELVTGTIKCQMKTSRSKICCLHNLVFSNVNFGTAVLILQVPNGLRGPDA